MRDSYKKFIEYSVSDEEVFYYLRINAKWNEVSFITMKQLVRDVIKDYEKADYYPKGFVSYFRIEILGLLGILPNIKKCTEKELLEMGYTDETYLKMLEERTEQLTHLKWDMVCN